MRGIAVVANLAQMAIILLVFLLKGVALGGWVIFALFLMLIIAFFNLLVLLFHSTLSRKDPTRGVKRQDLRIAYVSEPYPTLVIGKRGFAVSDISEKGLRIRVGRHEKLKKRFKGELNLVCETSIPVRARLIRHQGDEAALALKQPLDYAILLKEKQSVGMR